jgi:hypothetical protein
MWFNPSELSIKAIIPSATFATSATLEVESSKVARVADPLSVKNYKSGLESSKVAGPDNNTFVSCAKCLHFKSHHSHGKGAGCCLVGGAYGAWSETQRHCTKFDAAVEWVVMPDPKPNAIMVIVYTPNGNAMEIEARDEAHAVWLQQMNPKPPQGILK